MLIHGRKLMHESPRPPLSLETIRHVITAELGLMVADIGLGPPRFSLSLDPTTGGLKVKAWEMLTQEETDRIYAILDGFVGAVIALDGKGAE